MIAYEEKKQILVRCIKMLEQNKIMDYNGHASIKINKNQFLINIGDCQRSQLSVGDICQIDFDGNVMEGKGKPPLEFHLHAGIYKSRSDVGAVIHCHPKWSTVLSTARIEYLPVYAQGSLLYPVPVLNSPDSINSVDMANKLTKTLADRPAALMKAHGVVTTGENIIDAFVLLNYLEENSERQYRAQLIGEPYSFSNEELELCYKKLYSKSLFLRTWNHFSAKLDGIILDA